MVAAQLGVAEVEVLTCRADVVDYDLEALTTAARYWVRGTARHPRGEAPYAFFVKVVQSWGRSSFFAFVPEEHRAVALASVPWRSEPLVYRSDLANRLPAGLRLPRAYGVRDIDGESAAIWLEAVDADPTPWDHDRFARAAYRLGRLAASPAIRPIAQLGKQDVVPGYAFGRVSMQVLPALRDPGVRTHPLVARTFSADLQERLLDAAERLPDVVAELQTLPLGAAHGDACTRNLLVPREDPDSFVLIDFGFWCVAPLGFDLTQLLLGEVQMGERPASELPELEKVCMTAYLQGLADEGSDAAPEQVRRAHALLMLLFAGYSSFPIEHLDREPTPELIRVARERAASTEFVLDLVNETTPR
jgi:hypothetical protein